MDTNKSCRERGGANKILLVAAMPKEARELLPLFENTPERIVTPLGFEAWQGLTHEARSLVLVVTGIGKVSAAVAIRLFSPSLVLNVGVSGTLSQEVERGDIVVADRVCYHDVYCGTELAYGQVQGYPLYYLVETIYMEKLRATVVPFHIGGVACGDRFLSDPAEFIFIQEHFPEALALDMESAAVAQTSYIHQLPIMVIRLISDTPSRADGYAQYQQFWQDREYRKACFASVHKLIRAL